MTFVVKWQKLVVNVEVVRKRVLVKAAARCRYFAYLLIFARTYWLVLLPTMILSKQQKRSSNLVTDNDKCFEVIGGTI